MIYLLSQSNAFPIISALETKGDWPCQMVREMATNRCSLCFLAVPSSFIIIEYQCNRLRRRDETRNNGLVTHPFCFPVCVADCWPQTDERLISFFFFFFPPYTHGKEVFFNLFCDFLYARAHSPCRVLALLLLLLLLWLSLFFFFSVACSRPFSSRALSLSS